MTRSAQSSNPDEMRRSAWRCLAAGDLGAAQRACQALNRGFPKLAEGWHVSSHVAQAMRRLGKALEFIDRALQLEADNPVYLAQKAGLLKTAGRMAEAIPMVRSLTTAVVTSPSAGNIIGATLSQFGHHQAALAAFDAAIAGGPGQPHYHFNRAAELRFLGRLAEAEAACDRALELDPSNCEAYLLRSDLRRQSQDRNHVNELRHVLDRGQFDWRGEAQLRFALAKELEDLEAYGDSFGQRRRAADLRRRHMQYEVGADIAAIDRIIERFPARLFQAPSRGFDSEAPIFIIGLPRTGTTLLERILEGHTAVESLGELNQFAAELVRLLQAAGEGRPADRDALIDASPGMDHGALGQAYMEAIAPLRGDVPRCIDKLPLNYLYAGLIHLAMPNATIIHMRRHPVAACYAVYKHPFRDAYPFSYDLDDLGRYYMAYHRLMAHWRNCIPESAMLEVHYERLVEEPEREARRVVRALGLEWQPDCLEFQRRTTASTTASAAQVRQPVYRTSLAQWRHYEAELEPLIQRLADAGIAAGPAED